MSNDNQNFAFTITLIRHGETHENTQGIIQGQMDTKLNALGREQARLLGAIYPITECQLVYSSDLERAHETCRILIAEHKSNNNNKPPIVLDIRLRERSMGVMHGKSMQELKQAARESGKSVVEYVPSQAEGAADVRGRVVDFVENRLLPDVCMLNKSDAKVCLVSHGGVIREMIAYFASFGHASLNVAKARLIPPNTSISDFKIKVKTEGADKLCIESIECLVLHDMSHLNEDIQAKALNQPQVNEGIAI